MMEFIISNINVLGVLPEECWILGQAFYDELQFIFTAIQIAVPCLVVVLCSVDMAKAVIAQDDKAVKKAQSDAIKRLIIGAAIFFVPLLIDILLGFAGMITGTCNIG